MLTIKQVIYLQLLPKKPCSKVGCSELTRSRYCEEHAKLEWQRSDRERGSAAQRGYGHRWRLARESYLREHPLCIYCMKEVRVNAATVIDHIKPHKGNKVLFWDRNNWQPLCKSHHDKKTARYDGGFGNEN
ncbi:HNH endonuclease [Paenibacillus spongiae]|uniref:Putative HNH nuclease YajD n=2 Tax=Paenibacillus spongiae TaxID=2909671 RepID=A0ABY5SJ99_9BACL|nr:HNH endonuclease [Paenibacillus spongiae]